jgi:hypothetical protein
MALEFKIILKLIFSICQTGKINVTQINQNKLEVK